VSNRVLIDATAVPSDRGGVGRYVDSLVAALAKDGAADNGDLVVACQRRDAELYASLAPQATVLPAAEQVVTRTARLAWEQTTLPVLARRLNVAVVHSPHYTMPLAAPCAGVVTLHDATFFTDPGLHSPVKSRFFRSWTRLSLRRATRCVVPSHSAADQLAAVTGARRDRLVVAHHGVDTERFHLPRPQEVAAVRDRLGLDGTPYIGFLGALEPRKNVPALLAGYTMAARDRPDPPALVLAGQPGWDREVERALDAVPHRLRVVRAGYLPLIELAGFLGGAQVVAYPSLGEGFGLPVLEAMACGVPVLTTRRLSLPEVGGEAVAYCAPTAAGVGDALGALLDDPARRACLGARASARAAGFSWADSAAAHRTAYDCAVRIHRRG
jgi:glycosyltransferase involved in cell wall biosynthesis